MTLRILIFAFSFLAFTCRAQDQSNQNELQECTEAYLKYEGGLEKIEQQLARLKECMVGKKFPAFSAKTIAGKTYSKADLQGNVVLLASWFKGCSPCVAEIPILNELHKEFKDRGFLLLSFSTDDLETIQNFVKTKPISYDVFPSSQELIEQKLKTTYSYPTVIILNKKGLIVEYTMGGSTDANTLTEIKNELRETIKKELAK